MRVFVVLATFFLAANALDKAFIQEFMAKVKSIGDECIPEVSASKDDIDSLMARKVPDSHEGKCLIFCFHKHFHIQNDDGSIDREGSLKAIEPLKEQDMDVYNKVYNVFKACEETPVDSDPCVYSANLAECAVKEGKNMGLDDLLLVEVE